MCALAIVIQGKYFIIYSCQHLTSWTACYAHNGVHKYLDTLALTNYFFDITSKCRTITSFQNFHKSPPGALTRPCALQPPPQDLQVDGHRLHHVRHDNAGNLCTSVVLEKSGTDRLVFHPNRCSNVNLTGLPGEAGQLG